ncbi:uncharacterized protein [Hyperolius riggenbachi]|uniref:uncharacterized protein n=1 Tax=Hyperolius riggenbachi TaxID=752182 RepID=UPI0035A34027
MVDFKYKAGFIDGNYYFYWNCYSGDCGSQTESLVQPVENKTTYPSRWYQSEGYMKRRVYSDKPFTLVDDSCCWVNTVNFAPGWLLSTTVDLGVRSDTHKPNTSPVTTIIPILRIPSNCATSINLLAHDPDGDSVTCRHAYYGECGSCNRYFSIDQNRCVISVSSGWATGSYILELVLEDFPKRNIHLQYNDGTIVHKSKLLLRKTREVPKKSEKYWWDTWSTAVTATDISYSEAATSDVMFEYSASTESVSFTTLGNSGGTSAETVAVTQWDDTTSPLHTTAWYDETSPVAATEEVDTSPDFYTTETTTTYSTETTVATEHVSTTDTLADIFTTDLTTDIVTTYPRETTVVTGDTSIADSPTYIVTTDLTTAIFTTYPRKTTVVTENTSTSMQTIKVTQWGDTTSSLQTTALYDETRSVATTREVSTPPELFTTVYQTETTIATEHVSTTDTLADIFTTDFTTDIVTTYPRETAVVTGDTSIADSPTYIVTTDLTTAIFTTYPRETTVVTENTSTSVETIKVTQWDDTTSPLQTTALYDETRSVAMTREVSTPPELFTTVYQTETTVATEHASTTDTLADIFTTDFTTDIVTTYPRETAVVTGDTSIADTPTYSVTADLITAIFTTYPRETTVVTENTSTSVETIEVTQWDDTTSPLHTTALYDETGSVAVTTEVGMSPDFNTSETTTAYQTETTVATEHASPTITLADIFGTDFTTDSVTTYPRETTVATEHASPTITLADIFTTDFTTDRETTVVTEDTSIAESTAYSVATDLTTDIVTTYPRETTVVTGDTSIADSPTYIVTTDLTTAIFTTYPRKTTVVTENTSTSMQTIKVTQWGDTTSSLQTTALYDETRSVATTREVSTPPELFTTVYQTETTGATEHASTTDTLADIFTTDFTTDIVTTYPRETAVVTGDTSIADSPTYIVTTDLTTAIFTTYPRETTVVTENTSTSVETIKVTQWDDTTSPLHTTALYDETGSVAVTTEVGMSPDFNTTETTTAYQTETTVATEHASPTITLADIFGTDFTTDSVTTYPRETTVATEHASPTITLADIFTTDFTTDRETTVVTEGTSIAESTAYSVATDLTTAIFTTYPRETTVVTENTSTSVQTIEVTQSVDTTSPLHTTAWYEETSPVAVTTEVGMSPDFYTTEKTTAYATETTVATEHASPTITIADIFTTDFNTDSVTIYPRETSVVTEDISIADSPAYSVPADLTTAIFTTYPRKTTLNTECTSNADTTTDIFTTYLTTDSVTTYYTETTVVTEDADMFTTYLTSSIVTTIDYPTETATVYDDTTQHISTLDSTYTTSYPSDYMALSKIPLQFLVEVTSSAPSCTFGDYRPKFLPPTPLHGEKLLAHADKTFQLYLSASAVYESITDFKVSGPPGMTKKLTQQSRAYTRSITVEWTPKETNVGEHIPVCFVAETINGYQSELRCVYIVIGPSKLVNTDLFCHENTMTLIISKSADNELYQNHFHLIDPKCLVSSNRSHLVASVAYNTCGTETEETEDYIVFKNIAISYDNTSVIITRKNGVSIPFNCSFPKKNRLSASFQVHKNDYIFEEAGFGNFTYRFQFFTDGTFSVVNTQYPVEVELREPLYMEIQVSSSVPNVRLFVESCRATPHDNPNDRTFYDIIKNGCTTDSTVVVYPGTRTQYRFGMEAFAFIGDYSEVYMSCTVILCKDGDLNTRCTRGCITKSEAAFNNRRRRSLVSESQKHFISQGPVRMKRETSTAIDVEKTGMVIALSVMGTLVLIAIMQNIYMKKSRTASYQKLQSQEC